METDTIVFSIFLIFTGAAILSTLALYTRQSLLVAYILLGAMLGPWGLKWVADSVIIKQVGEVGIIFLLFLLGLHLQPQNLLHMLRKVTRVTIASSLLLLLIGFAIGYLFGFSIGECLVIGAAMMFSSTIIGLKLLPTSILHHQHIGEVMISVLLMQDLLAIIVLLFIHAASSGPPSLLTIVIVVLSLPGLLIFSFLVARYVLVKLLARFDQVQEYIFLISIGWCLGMAELANLLGLSPEIGAFVGGVALAASPIALYVAESLKPLRDFFLVMFFFAIGASFNFEFLPVVILPAAILAVFMLLVKPILFKFLLTRAGESNKVSWEVGTRLGQASEFSLLVAYLASQASPVVIGEAASYFIQATTIFTFIASSYIVVLRYPTPVALSDKLRRD